MKPFPAYLLLLFCGISFLTLTGCIPEPDPKALKPYETIHLERIALKEEMIAALNAIVDEDSANRAIPVVLNIRERQKAKRAERDALGPAPPEVSRYIQDKYYKRWNDLIQEQDDAARRASKVPGSERFFNEVSYFLFKVD